MKPRLWKIFLLTCIAVILLAAPGCSQSEDTTAPVDDNTKLTAAVSIEPAKTFVEAVAGDLVDVAVMIPPGNSPANYAPSPQEMVGLSDAVIYFSLDVPAEQANILPVLKDFNPDIKLVNLASKAAEHYKEREFSPGSRDPHIWLSPKRVQVMVETIADELSLIDPENKDVYMNNANNYREQLNSLDENIKLSLQGMQTKTFIVYHPAFGYFAEDYGLTMVAIEQDGKEATAQHIQTTIDLAKKQGIKVIFYQAAISSKQADAIAEDINGYTAQIDPLAADYIDNMQKMSDTFARILD